MAAPSKPTSYRLDDVTLQLIKAIAAEDGSTDVQVIRTAVRALARRRGIQVVRGEAPEDEGE